jgi:ornithine carbamoyltransferase
MIEVARKLKAETKAGIPHPILQGKTLALIFTKSSTRTRVAFEAGIYQLGGYGLFLSSQELQIGRGEPVQDTARVLSRMLDGIMIRTFSHQEVEDLARFGSVPVINGLTDYLHPTQVLADLMTVAEHKGELAGLKLAFVGDGNNVANSLLIGCSKMGVHISVAAPSGHKPVAEILKFAGDNAAKSGSRVEIVDDPQEAVQGADVVYTDVWASMGQEAEMAERRQAFANYQVNADLMKLAKPDAIIMHCLPAHRGEEISDEAMECAQSVIYDESENRLHAHKAIMALLL